MLATSTETAVLSGYRACMSTAKLVVNVFVLTVDLDLHADLAGLSQGGGGRGFQQFPNFFQVSSYQLQ
jgi:hypothetical protein